MAETTGGFNHSDGVKLREYFEMTCDARRQTITARLDAMDKALTLYQDLQNTRMEQANETKDMLRQQIAEGKEIAALSVTRAEYDAALERMGDDIKSLRESRAELAGKADQQSVTDVAEVATRSQIIAGAGVFFGIVSLIVSILLHK